MRITASSFALSINAAALLAACGGSQPPIGAPGAMPQSRMLKTTAQPLRTDDRRSWMDPSAMHSDLLYVTDGVAKVYVYTYPQGRHVGTLTGFTDPLGECVDQSGDVFIVSSVPSSYYYPGAVTEYAHGGTKPIQTLQVPLSGSGCAVEPATRLLAVAGGLYDYSGNFAALAYFIYHTLGYTPGDSSYTRDFDPFQMCGWDSQGDLYLSSGYPRTSEASLVLYPQGTNGYGSERLKVNEPLYSYRAPVSVQWDGKNMTVSSTPYQRPVKLYQLSISGSTATVVGTTTLKSKSNDHKTSQVWIQGKSVVDVDYFDLKGGVDRWAYPNATKAYRVVPNSLRGKFYGLVISKAP